VYESSPSWEHYALWTAIFSAINLSVPRAVSYSAPLIYSNLSSKRKAVLAAYISCLFHHFYVVYYAIRLYIIEFNSPHPSLKEYNMVTTLFPFMFGYFISDTIFFSIPELIYSGITPQLFVVLMN
jgi:hypothetical protein